MGSYVIVHYADALVLQMLAHVVCLLLYCIVLEC
jgi:hypothetical protein